MCHPCRATKREEILKPYNYQIEYDINDDGILDKRSNKEKGNYDYLDMFPNGEGYKFVNNEIKKLFNNNNF